MNTYYHIGYDRRLGGDFVDFFDEDLKLTETIRVRMNIFGEPVLPETGLPAIGDEIRIVRWGEHVSPLLDTEPIEGSRIWERVVDNKTFTDEEREEIAKNATEKPKRSKALADAQKRYDERMKKVILRLDAVADADLVEKLAEVPSMQAYIKELIRKDLKSYPEKLYFSKKREQ